MFAALFRRLNWDPRKQHKRRSPARQFRPQFETLEPRLALSGVVANIAPFDSAFERGLPSDVRASFAVTRAGGVGGHAVDVYYQVGLPGDSAVRGEDYVTAGRRKVHFGRNETTKHIDVIAKKDWIHEDDETFRIRLTKIKVSRGGEGSFANRVATGVVKDSNAKPIVRVSSPQAGMLEGEARRVHFNLIRGVKNFKRMESTKTITVNYKVEGVSDTLDVNQDINVPRGLTGTITFAPGQNHKTMLVRAVDDKIVEDTEQLQVEATGATNATVIVIPPLNQKLLNIRDNDKAVVSIRGTINPRQETFLEGNAGNTLATVQVVLGNKIEKPWLTVAYRTAPGTARAADNDFVPKKGTVQFNKGSLPGDTQNVVVEIVGDLNRERAEDFFVNLIGWDSYRIARRAFKIVIANDD